MIISSRSRGNVCGKTMLNWRHFAKKCSHFASLGWMKNSYVYPQIGRQWQSLIIWLQCTLRRGILCQQNIHTLFCNKFYVKIWFFLAQPSNLLIWIFSLLHTILQRWEIDHESILFVCDCLAHYTAAYQVRSCPKAFQLSLCCTSFIRFLLMQALPRHSYF